MQDGNDGSIGGAPTPQEQPPVDPVASADTQQVSTGEQAPDQPVTNNVAADPVSPVTQPVTGVVTEPAAPAPTPMDASTPSPVPSTPTIGGVPVTAGDTAATPEKKKNKTLAIVLSVLAVVVIGVVVAVVLLMGNKGSLSIQDVEKYCKDNGYETSVEHSEDPRADGVMCVGEGDISGIQYAVFDGQMPGMDELDASLSILDNTILVNSGDYKKVFYSFYGTHGYVIIRGNTYLLMGGKNNDAMKKALLDLGYPDDKWPDESMITTSSWGDDDDDDDSSSLLPMQRDTQRRNDLARVDTSLVQYQTNNSGNLMAGPSYWEGSTYFDCDTGDIACEFVQLYMNSSSSDEENEFVDPDGTPYSVFITENWVDNGKITTSFGNKYSELVEDEEDGYTIGGSSPFDQHVIYIVPGASCSRYTSVVKASNNKHFAILYQLEDDDEAYCLDDM